MDYSLFVPERLEPWPLAWDGVSPSYYTPDYSPISDYQVMSPQIQAMNWVPYLEEAFRLNPSLWFELSVWDGQQDKSDNDKAAHYRMVGQRYDAQRYKGYVEFGMWLLRPRLLREFRDPRTTPTRFVDYFNSIADAVKLVHSDSVLRRFWQDGHLVPNTKQNHPYSTSLPERLKTTERWFLLDTAANPKRPWQLDTPLSVYALSLRTGVHPHQEWLIYAYSPLVDSIDTELQIPNGPIVTVTAKRGGCFTHIGEHSKKMDRIAC